MPPINEDLEGVRIMVKHDDLPNTQPVRIRRFVLCME
jgi:hypothetical protein